MKTQLPIEVIPEGFYCYQIINLSLEKGVASAKLCPYLKIDKENKIKKCCFLDDVEISEFKECQINLGVE